MTGCCSCGELKIFLCCATVGLLPLSSYKHIIMKKVFLFAILASASLLSCKKSNDTSPVQVRIKNNTEADFISATVANISFGEVKAGGTTSYKSFQTLGSYTGINAVTATDTIYTGVLFCGTPGLQDDQMMKPGQYVLEVSEDPTSFFGYKSIFIKE
jgi:hypothetical protein